MSTPRRQFPSDGPLQAIVERMKKIADQSGDSLLLADAPPHPDFQLLDLCDRLLAASKKAESLWAERQAIIRYDDPAAIVLRTAHRVKTRECTKLLTIAGRLPAKTGAGILAKALMIRATSNGTLLSKSLAADLIDNREIRASIWSAEPI